MTTAYDDYPTALCSCGTSIHDYPGSRKAHEDKRHSVDNPATYRLFDQRGEVTREIEFWEEFYSHIEES